MNESVLKLLETPELHRIKVFLFDNKNLSKPTPTLCATGTTASTKTILRVLIILDRNKELKAEPENISTAGRASCFRKM